MQNGPVADFAKTVTFGSLVLGALFTLVFCLLIIWFLNARKARDAFAGKFEPEPHEELLARFDALNEDDDFRRPEKTPWTIRSPPKRWTTPSSGPPRCCVRRARWRC
jgi:hypothetical protein